MQVNCTLIQFKGIQQQLCMYISAYMLKRSQDYYHLKGLLSCFYFHFCYWLFWKSSQNHEVWYQFYGIQTSSGRIIEEQSRQKSNYAWAISGLLPASHPSCSDVTKGYVQLHKVCCHLNMKKFSAYQAPLLKALKMNCTLLTTKNHTLCRLVKNKLTIGVQMYT
jgi:hypothetical protein